MKLLVNYDTLKVKKGTKGGIYANFQTKSIRNM